MTFDLLVKGSIYVVIAGALKIKPLLKPNSPQHVGLWWYKSQISWLFEPRTTTMAKKLSKSKTSVSLNKSQQIFGMLKRVNSASIPELVKATDWQSHSIRGFLSRHVKKKLGLKITSSSEIGKDRRYRIQDAA